MSHNYIISDLDPTLEEQGGHTDNHTLLLFPQPPPTDFGSLLDVLGVKDTLFVPEPIGDLGVEIHMGVVSRMTSL